MISLTTVESYISKLWPTFQHAALRAKHPTKGEEIILVTDNQDANKKDIISFFNENGLSTLMIPSKIIYRPSIPLLGSGKVDYKNIQIDETK